MKGKQAYEMRMDGNTWGAIAFLLGVNHESTARNLARRYAAQNGLTLNSQKHVKHAPKKQTGDDAQRWHKLHCGGGMNALAIADYEGVPVEIVRSTLQAYRQKMWG